MRRDACTFIFALPPMFSVRAGCRYRSALSGKYIKLQYDDDFRLVGARTEHFLLEKSRLVNVENDERSYHILYQVKQTKASGRNQKERTHRHYLNGRNRNEPIVTMLGLGAPSPRLRFVSLRLLLSVSSAGFRDKSPAKNRRVKDSTEQKRTGRAFGHLVPDLIVPAAQHKAVQVCRMVRLGRYPTILPHITRAHVVSGWEYLFRIKKHRSMPYPQAEKSM